MVAFEELKRRVQFNCDISDAKYASIYSLCGLLLRLRDHYKSVHGLSPWQEPESADLLEWIDAREKLWEELVDVDFHPLNVDSETFAPFDMNSINARLRPLGLVYGAGYAAGMKPSFFLGKLIESRQVKNLTVDVVGQEFARDLFFSPAMRQGDQIFARRSAMLFLIWDQILELRPSAREALGFALRQYDIDLHALRHSPKHLGPGLYRVAELELETWIYHEMGEAYEDAFEGYLWHEIVSTYSNGPIELFARAIKDLLADTHSEGLLGHIIRHRIKSSLAFYVSFMHPFVRLLFPEVREAFRHFKSNDEWTAIEDARKLGYSRAQSQTLVLIDLHEAGRKHGLDWATNQIMVNLIEPLGIMSHLSDHDMQPAELG